MRGWKNLQAQTPLSFRITHMYVSRYVVRSGAAFENPGPLKVPSCEISHAPTWDGHFWGRGTGELPDGFNMHPALPPTPYL
jgi:hypothetical protein